MSKGKLIYWFGILFLIVTLVKYLYVPTVFPPVYFTFEVLGVFVVLAMLFYTKTYKIHKKDCHQEEFEKQVLLLKEENKQLRVRIEELESEENEERTFASIKELLVAELVEKLNSASKDELATQMFSLIKKHFELVGGIVYAKGHPEADYQVIKHFGFDDEVPIPPVVMGEGLHGQVIKDKRAKEIDEVPEEYLEVSSGTGSTQPTYIYFLPLVDVDGNDIFIEIASFKKLGMDIIWNEFLDGLTGQKNN